MTTVRPAAGKECAVVSLENREEALLVHAVLVGIVDGEVGNEVHR